jgi:hypothetical protein
MGIPTPKRIEMKPRDLMSPAGRDRSLGLDAPSTQTDCLKPPASDKDRANDRPLPPLVDQHMRQDSRSPREPSPWEIARREIHPTTHDPRSGSGADPTAFGIVGRIWRALRGAR